MDKCVTKLIPENVVPKGTKGVGVYNSGGVKVGYIPFGRTSRPTGEPDYTVCVLSDVHVMESKYPTSTEDFQRALEYAEENCDFTCIAGDLTDQGIADDLGAYQAIVSSTAKTKPVYAIAGNHENYSGRDPNLLLNATGHPLYYSFTHGNDVFIMVGHYGGYDDSVGNWLSTNFISVEELQWLYDTLETNRNKRCFIYTHVLPIAHGVGDPCGMYGTRSGNTAKLWRVDDGGIGQAFVNLLCHYKNTVLFHGHSHTALDMQRLDPKANYSNANGYRSVHVPSLAVPRDDIDGDGDLDKNDDLYSESEGYIKEVYPDYIILNGWNFANGHWIPLGTIKINTPLVTVEEGTFIDSTGLIKT